NKVSSSGSGGDRFGFTGREHEAALNLYYNRARFYDPATGRFLSKDPIGFSAGDVNLYRYVNNSPTNGTDPSGESWLDDYANWFPDLGIGRNIIYPILREAIGDETLAGASDTQNCGWNRSWHRRSRGGHLCWIRRHDARRSGRDPL
ncbi:MAG: RHS repeat-associated core domain-containing protein, partial [Planctomycetota bacterium]